MNDGLEFKDLESIVVRGTDVFVALRLDNGVFRSTDKGGTWSAMNDGLPDLSVKALAVSGGTLFAGTRGAGVSKAAIGSSTVDDSDSKPVQAHVYPVPAYDNVTIDLPSDFQEHGLSSPIVAGLYSTSGALASRLEATASNQGRLVLQLGDVPAGIYVVRVQCGARIVEARIVVVR
jgi:hypothetical protein